MKTRGQIGYEAYAAALPHRRNARHRVTWEELDALPYGHVTRARWEAAAEAIAKEERERCAALVDAERIYEAPEIAADIRALT